MSGRLDYDRAKRMARGLRGEPVERDHTRKHDDPRWRITYPREFPVTVTRKTEETPR